MMDHPSDQDDVRGWARGSYPLEAATELLIRAFHGRFTEPGWPWMMTDEGSRWIEFDSINDDCRRRVKTDPVASLEN